MNISKRVKIYLLKFSKWRKPMTDLELFMRDNKPAGNNRHKKYEMEILCLLASKHSAKDIKEFLDSQHIAPVGINTVRRYIRQLKQNYDIASIRVE